MYRSVRKIVSVFVLVIISNGAWCQDTVLTLQEIINIAEKNYPGLLQYQSRAKSKEELAKGAKSWMPPTLSFGLDRFPYKPEMAMEDEGSDIIIPPQRSIMISAQQMIPNPLKQKAKQEYQLSLGAVESNNYDWARQQLRKEIKILYYQRYIAEKKQVLISEAEQLLELIIKTSEDAYTYNKASLSTIFKARARKAELSNMKTMLDAQIGESTTGLSIFMQRPLTSTFRIDTANSITSEFKDLAAGADKLRSDIEAMESTIKTMELNKTLMKSALKPDFGVNVTHMQMLDMPPAWSVMGMITLPLVPWSSKMTRAEVSSMELEIQAMKQQKSTMELMSSRMITEKRIMVESERKQLDNYTNEIVPAYYKNFESALSGYKQNTSDFFILLDAWEMMLMKKTEAADKEFQALKLAVEYQFESGQLK